MGDNNAFVLDNGAFYAKLGLSDDPEPKTILNCITKAKSERRRPFIGNQIEECRDASGLFYILCFQRGYLVNWDVQKTVWDYLFSPDCCPVQFADTPLLITEPLFNFGSIQEAMLEILYEEYDCDAVCKSTAIDLAAFNYTHSEQTEQPEGKRPLACVVVEMGFSFTHVVPFVKGCKVREAIRRIDVGGKVLTNHLKEIISYRQLNVMDESYVINQVKEDSCFVSQNFNEDMRIARKRIPDNTILREYVLPDYTQIRRGFLRKPNESGGAGDGGEELQTVRLGNERFVIPEILFHPSDVGIQQMGVPEAIVDAINLCPEETRPHLFANIVVCGGCALFPGMQSRVERDVRALAPDEYDVNVTVPENPITYAWHGGKKYSQSLSFMKSCMSRNEYEEYGTRHLVEKYES
ncbi:AGAP005857-PA [Anopheles gambiae str. PEST]|uniref:Actin-related protein 6 n=2 Tax=gambiae species complex TaxID=44542 RepID=Q7Q6G6_ANOGA|nr:actin-related protein 6 [Anopheles coluzzii]XP_315883.4 actin-related protein 6 [Anopheles gambiae]EAA11637.4 AGAP005857-PA [Anopheles gambiae str. PEST]